MMTLIIWIIYLTGFVFNYIFLRYIEPSEQEKANYTWEDFNDNIVFSICSWGFWILFAISRLLSLVIKKFLSNTKPPKWL